MFFNEKLVRNNLKNAKKRPFFKILALSQSENTE